MVNSDNPRMGSEFEKNAMDYYKSKNIELTRNYSIPIGFSNIKKDHKYDLGSDNPPILIECKHHSWTEGGNSPSAKLSVWNEAMFYFIAAPKEYKKILFVLKTVRKNESLAQHYVKRYGHLIPPGVELWEYSIENRSAEKVNK